MRVSGLLFLFLTAGCAMTERAPSESSPSPVKTPAIESSTTVSPSTPGAAKKETPNNKTVNPSQTTKKTSTAPSAAKPETASLDLTSLETRLKETKAIGVFTKITLKNQVDDLLNQFRAHYQGQAKTTLAELRQPYDRLLLKVLSLLQDGDPELARAIVASREKIWAILSDPKKFATIST